MDGTYSQALIAGIEALFPGGRHFNLLETSNAVDLVFYDRNNRIIAKADQVEAGLEYSPKDEKGRPIRFINIGITSALAQTVKIYVTDGDFRYRVLAGEINVSAADALNVQVGGNTLTANAHVALPNVTKTMIVGGSVTRKEVLLICDVDITIGHGVVSATAGFLLKANTSIVLSCSADLYAYNDSGAAGTAMFSIILQS